MTMVEDRLLLKLEQAAKMLSVSPRYLWGLTAPRGPIPIVRINRARRYSVDDLRRYIEQQRQTAAKQTTATK